MAQMEYELGEALPYWDWTEDGNVPDLWEGIRAPIQPGAVGSCSSAGGQFVTRSTSASINVTAQKKQVRDALDLTSDLTAFQNALNGPHGSIHFGMGGDMACLETAGYDPIFFLHHGNVDYIWAFWQEVARINGNSNPSIPGFNQPLEPYSNKVYNDNDRTFQKSRPQDTLDYRNNFCYQYDQLLHNNLTPQEFVYWNKNRNFCNPKPAQGKCGPSPCCLALPSGKTHCEVICSCRTNEGNANLCKVSAGVVLPKSGPVGNNNFQLCRLGNCVPGGTVGTFGAATGSGSGGPPGPPGGSSNDYAETPQIDDRKYFLRDTDVTDVVSEQGWSLDDPILARMTESVVENLPDPVVIIKKLGEDGKMENDKVTLSPNANPAMYGNLLEGYPIESRGGQCLFF